MRSSRRIALSSAAVALVATTLAVSDDPAAAAPREQRVVMFTDSVGLGARSALPAAFPADWDVHVDGEPARFVEQLEASFVQPRLSSNPEWFGDHVVIAAGYNYPHWDPDRFDRSIDSMIRTLTGAGVRHIHWVTLREVKPQYISAGAWRQIQPYYWYFPTVNEHLEQALERHPNLHLVDWAAVADRTGLTYDAIHLNTTGAGLYSRIIRASVDAAATEVADRSTTRVVVPDADGATAAFVNITTTSPRTSGHLRLWDCAGEPPLVSMHSFERAQTVAHAGIAPLDDDGAFCVYARTATNLVVDVTGTLTSASGFTTNRPTRLIDTRPSGRPAPGSTTPVETGAPGTAAVAVTATALGAGEPGWLRVAGCDTVDDADTANVNHPPGAATPNLAIVRPDANGDLCVVNRTDTHLIVDRFGAFGDPATISIDTPVRWLDTRETGAALPAETTTVLDLADVRGNAAAAAVIVNLTSVDALDPGYVAAYPCDVDRPLTANLNTPGGVISNAAIVSTSAQGTICIYNRSTMHLVVDLMGTLDESAFDGSSPIRLLDTRT